MERTRSAPWIGRAFGRFEWHGCDPIRGPMALHFEHRCSSICLLVEAMPVVCVQPRDVHRQQNPLTLVVTLVIPGMRYSRSVEPEAFLSFYNSCRCTWVESRCHLIASDNLQRVRVRPTKAVHVSKTSECGCAVVVHDHLPA